MVRSSQFALDTNAVVIAEGGGDGCQVYLHNKGTGAIYLGGNPNDVQRVVFTGGPTAGDFTLSLDGHATDDIAFDATAEDVQAALEGLSAIQPGDVKVSGPDLPTGFMLVEFTGAYAGTDVSEMTATDNLSGGSGEAVQISTVQAGGVTSSNGFELASGEWTTFELAPEDRLLALSASTSTVHVLVTGG